MKIEIPFNDWSKAKIKLEKKFATTRSKQYGKAGDYFVCEGKTCELAFVVRLPLWFISVYLYESEGAVSVKEFCDVWRSIHPKKTWESMLGLDYYYHFWSILSDDEARLENKL